MQMFSCITDFSPGSKEAPELNTSLLFVLQSSADQSKMGSLSNQGRHQINDRNRREKLHTDRNLGKNRISIFVFSHLSINYVGMFVLRQI